MRFHVLGRLEIHTGDGALPLPPKIRDLLAVLLCNPNQTVSADRLIDALWPCTPPRTATKTLQGYVHHLRKALGAARLESRRPGYVLSVGPGELDAESFTSRAESGRAAIAAGLAEEGTAAIRAALAMWRGVPYEGQEHLGPTQAEAFRLTELRLTAAEEWADAELARGRPASIVGELHGIVADHPFRERLRAGLMRALYAMGRSVEALEVGREGRRVLADELGLDPSPTLRRLEHAILTHDPALGGQVWAST
ncbi:AfsR/SARP family transcriptional regulator [Nonomuraea sp. SYSU D8015]|uniref:AfsR/SARP family transcriptional regulator n=1 Tax=Nonomuraea sp. SYSU D8015 TaxID=2593644 RepID=UPI00166144F5|nr:AfsR/SARP family transcriptional regulator [Nonomuraea sp. SYSU D8015]